MGTEAFLHLLVEVLLFARGGFCFGGLDAFGFAFLLDEVWGPWGIAETFGFVAPYLTGTAMMATLCPLPCRVTFPPSRIVGAVPRDEDR